MLHTSLKVGLINVGSQASALASQVIRQVKLLATNAKSANDDCTGSFFRKDVTNIQTDVTVSECLKQNFVYVEQSYMNTCDIVFVISEHNEKGLKAVKLITSFLPSEQLVIPVILVNPIRNEFSHRSAMAELAKTYGTVLPIDNDMNDDYKKSKAILADLIYPLMYSTLLGADINDYKLLFSEQKVVYAITGNEKGIHRTKKVLKKELLKLHTLPSIKAGKYDYLVNVRIPNTYSMKELFSIDQWMATQFKTDEQYTKKQHRQLVASKHRSTNDRLYITAFIR